MSACKACGRSYRSGTRVQLMTAAEGVDRALRMLRTFAAFARSKETSKRDAGDEVEAAYWAGRAVGLEAAIETLDREVRGPK